jgi:hypothetical protein
MEVKICDYPQCKSKIRQEDYLLKDNTAKLCEKHNAEFVKLVDEDDISKLTNFMIKIAFK